MSNRLNNETIQLIKDSESLHDGDLTKAGLQPKLDPVGIWTEGWGRAMIDPRTKSFIRGVAGRQRAYQLQSIFTEADADRALLADLKLYEKEVIDYAAKKRISLTDNQYGALVSFCYNVGGAAMRKTFDRVFQKGITAEQVLAAFGLYNKGTINGEKQVLPGLTIRRRKEATLFLK